MLIRADSSRMFTFSGERPPACSMLLRASARLPASNCCLARLYSTPPRASFHFMWAFSFWVSSFLPPFDAHPPTARVPSKARGISFFANFIGGLLPGVTDRHTTRETHNSHTQLLEAASISAERGGPFGTAPSGFA